MSDDAATPATMPAMLLTGHGGFDKLVYVTDHPTPRPGPGEVLIRVGACGLNNTDVNTRTGWYAHEVREGITDAGAHGGFGVADDAPGTWSGRPLAFPRVQGADVAGVVAAVGEGVDAGRIGERVMVDPWLLDPDDPADLSKADFFGSEVDGGFAGYALAPAGNAHRVESDLSDAELATFACSYVTAENLVRRVAPSAGETIVITGASGGVGSAAIQLAGLRGARVVAIASQSKGAALLDLGAAAVVDRRSPDLEAAILNAAQGARIDAAVDVVGGPMFGPLIAALRPGGRYSTAGALGGPIVELDLRELIHKDLEMTGATVVPPGTFARVVSYIEQGRLRPLVADTYPLSKLPAAQAAFLTKQHVGNIVVTM